MPPSRSVADRVLDTARSLDLSRRFTRAAAPQADESPDAGADSRLGAAEATWSLTARQGQVLRYLVEGASNKEIAQQLECAENTVELHVTKLLQKARVASRTRLIARFWLRCAA